MSIEEKSLLLRTVDKDSNEKVYYPITRKENVLGLDDTIQNIYYNGQGWAIEELLEEHLKVESFDVQNITSSVGVIEMCKRVSPFYFMDEDAQILWMYTATYDALEDGSQSSDRLGYFVKFHLDSKTFEKCADAPFDTYVYDKIYWYDNKFYVKDVCDYSYGNYGKGSSLYTYDPYTDTWKQLFEPNGLVTCNPAECIFYENELLFLKALKNPEDSNENKLYDARLNLDTLEITYGTSVSKNTYGYGYSIYNTSMHHIHNGYIYLLASNRLNKININNLSDVKSCGVQIRPGATCQIVNNIIYIFGNDYNSSYGKFAIVDTETLDILDTIRPEDSNTLGFDSCRLYKSYLVKDIMYVFGCTGNSNASTKYRKIDLTDLTNVMENTPIYTTFTFEKDGNVYLLGNDANVRNPFNVLAEMEVTIESSPYCNIIHMANLKKGDSFYATAQVYLKDVDNKYTYVDENMESFQTVTEDVSLYVEAGTETSIQIK